MINSMLRTFLILGVLLGLTYLTVYIPDYLTFQAWEPTVMPFMPVDGSPGFYTVYEATSQGATFVVYWAVECKYCAAQREALREFLVAEGNGRISIIYVNIYDTVEEIQAYVKTVGVVQGVPEYWVRGLVLPEGVESVPHVIFSQHSASGWSELAFWTGAKTLEQLYAFFEMTPGGE